MPTSTFKPTDKMRHDALQVRIEDQAVETFLTVHRALQECSDEVQQIVQELLEVVRDPETDPDDLAMVATTIREALFPSCHDGAPGLDLEELETEEAAGDPPAAAASAELDEQEAAFADRVRRVMEAKGLTQAALADAAGLNQPAVSMMLSRRCRPQRRTVHKIAAALGVPPEELWPAAAG